MKIINKGFYTEVEDPSKKKYTLTIEFPPGTLYLMVALAVVYDVQFMLLTIGSLTILLTILKQIGWLK